MEKRSIFKHVVDCCLSSCFRYVLLVSGLNLGSMWSSQLSVQMMVDYIAGQLGGPKVCSEGGKGVGGGVELLLLQESGCQNRQ